MARTLKALLIPADQSAQITEVSGTLNSLLAKMGADFPAKARGYNAQKRRFCAVMDDNGEAKNLPVNRRAQFISGYAGILVGDALIFGEEIVEDEDGIPGIDFVDVPRTVIDWVAEENTKLSYAAWTLNACPMITAAI